MERDEVFDELLGRLPMRRVSQIRINARLGLGQKSCQDALFRFTEDLVPLTAGYQSVAPEIQPRFRLQQTGQNFLPDARRNSRTLRTHAIHELGWDRTIDATHLKIPD